MLAAPPPALTAAVGGVASAREVQALLNRVTRDSVPRTAARLVALLASGEANAQAVAAALARFAFAFAPDTYAALALAVTARCGCALDSHGSALGAHWTSALGKALAERLLSDSGALAFATELIAERAGTAVSEEEAHSTASRALALAVAAALEPDALALSASSSPEKLQRYGLVLFRLGPLLVRHGLDATTLDRRLMMSVCTSGCASPPPAGSPPRAPCANCAAWALSRDGWVCSTAALAPGDSTDCAHADGCALTESLLTEGSQLTNLRAMAAALPWRQESRAATVCGLELTFQQQPRFQCGDGARRADAGSTGLVLWGAASLLAWFLEHDAPTCQQLHRGCAALELGCGAGLVAAAAGVLGGHVTATDGDMDVVRLAHINADAAMAAARQAGMAGIGSVHAQALLWGDAEHLGTLTPPYELVLASDVAFFVEAHDALFRTLCAIFRASPNATMLMAHTWRRNDAEAAFFSRLASSEGGLACDDVTPTAEGAPKPHGTRLLRLRLAETLKL